MAGNTPFKRWKREVHEGGVADPCIVSWPARLVRRVRRRSATSSPTPSTSCRPCSSWPASRRPAEIDGVAQSQLDGVSFALLLGAAGLPGRRATHVTQHFEMFGSRAIYHDGWKAVTFHPVGPIYDDGLNPNASFDDDVWELYHVAEDLSETRRPGRASSPSGWRDLIELWWEEAERNDVLPLDNRPLWALSSQARPPARTRRGSATSRAVRQVPESVAVPVQNRSHAVRVDVVVPDGVVPEGVLLALGSALGGWSLHLLGRPPPLRAQPLRQGAATCSRPRDVVGRRSPHQVGFAFTKDEGLGGAGPLSVDGRVVAEGASPASPRPGSTGWGSGSPAATSGDRRSARGIEAPFPFNGIITAAVVEVTGPVVRDPLAEIAAILAEQ